MKNVDTPAMPLSGDAYIDFAAYNPDKNDSSYNPECQGLTKREQFCLKMGVAETGDQELDDIIRKGNKKKFAATAMQALIPVYLERYTQEQYETAEDLVKCLMESSVEHADALLKGLEK